MAANVPRDLGLVLIAAGVGGLAISAWQYRSGVRYLWSEPFRAIAGGQRSPLRAPVFLAALVLMGAGIAAFGAVLFRMT